MNQSYETLSALLEKTMALQTALIMFEWDNETLAPEGAGSYTSRVVGVLSQEYYNAMTGDEMGEAIAACEKEDGLTDIEQAIVREAREAREELVCVPAKEYRENAQLIAESARIWSKARKDGKFEDFAPTLEKVIGS